MSDRIEIVDDRQSRIKIETELNKNFFVEAGAGSGKTTELVRRMVALVENGADISKLCAITFTKAAAAEFYVRFQEKLSQKATSNANCQKALENIDLCFMGTIDSFCRMILLEHPVEARIPSDAKLMDEEAMKQVYERAYIDIRKGVYGEELRKKAALFKAYYWHDKDEFVYGMSRFMGMRNIHFNYDKEILKDLDVDKKYRQTKEDLVNIIHMLSSHREYAYSDYRAGVDEIWDNLVEYERILSQKWSTHLREVNNVLTQIHDRLLLCKIPAGVDYKYLQEQFNGWGKSAGFAFRGSIFSDLNDLKYSVSMDLLVCVSKQIEDHLRDQGNLSHFDYLYLLRNMLREDAQNGGRLAKHIFRRHSYFFLDEFQDTNPMQAEIFFYLCAKDTKTDWRECIPVPGSLFIVGDPKQSIYKFRSADIGSYLKVKKLFTKEVGEILYLRKNFRSQKQMTEHFNLCFNDSFPDADTDVQCTYNDIEIQEDRVTDTHLLEGVYTYDAYTGQKLITDYPDMVDEVRVADIIEKIVHNDNYKVLKSGEDTPRTIEYDDIMVITYSKGRLPEFIREFNARKIPCRAEGSVIFRDCPGLLAVRDVMQFIADYKSTKALVYVLKSRLMKYSDEEILDFVGRYGSGKPISIFGEYESVPEDDESGTRLAKRLTILKELVNESSLLAPAAVFMLIYEKMEIFKTVSTDNLEIFYYALELIRGAQANGGVVSVKKCTDYLNQLIEGESGEERCLSFDDDMPKVHLANLHKVKGLEAPIVFLTYWYPMPQNAGTYVDYSGNDPEGYIISLFEAMPTGQKIHFKTNRYDDMRQKDIEALEAEKLRLIYVAATRARQTLFICRSHSGRVGTIKSSWSGVITDKESHPFNLVDGIGLPFTTPDVINDADSLYKESEEFCVLNDRSSETPSFEGKTPSGIMLADKISEQAEGNAEIIFKSDIEATDREAVKKYPNHLGTMVHKLMEILVLSGGKIDISTCVNQILEQYLGESGAAIRESFEKVLKSVASQMLNGGYPQQGSLPQDIFDILKNADEVYCEVPFCYMEGSQLWKGELDVIYREGDSWHIVDYKTNENGSDLDTEYAGQLEAYRNAFKKLRNLEADAHTYHIII